MQVPPNAARELIRWGCESAMDAVCSQPLRINYRNWQTNEIEGTTDLKRHKKDYGAPYWQVYRPDYHQILFDTAIKAGATVRKGQIVVGYNPQDASVKLQSGEIVKGHLIVAADGIKSIARDALGIHISPHETGDTCFRAVITRDDLCKTPELASLSEKPSFEQFLGPDHHIIGYNIRKEDIYNLLMVIPDDHKMTGLKAPATANEVRHAFKDWSPMWVLLFFLLLIK